MYDIVTLLSTYFYKHARELIEEGYVYLAVPPLYKVKLNGKETFIKNKEDYNSLITKTIISTFPCIIINFSKEKHRPTPEEYTEILNGSYEYMRILDIVANELMIPKKLLETITLNYSNEKLLSKSMSNFYLNVETNDKGELVIDGLLDESYIHLIIDEAVKGKLSKLRNVLVNSDIRAIAYKDRKTGATITSTLGEFIEYVTNYCTPKEKQRFKGLGW